MSLITTNEGRIVLKKASSMMAVPYVYDSAVGDYVLGDDVYDISAIIGDSITLEQSDGNTEAKYNEFVGTPLIENTSGGKYSFTAQCIDLQDKVLQALFGAMTVSGTSGAIAFNADYVELYALIRISFDDESLPIVVLPKVHMNSKLFIQQLRTRMSQGNIAGTAMPHNCGIENAAHNALLSFSSISSEPTYTPFTPVLFVPRNSVPVFYNKKNTSNLDYYSAINFDTGDVSNNIVVNPSDGSVLISSGGNGDAEQAGGGNDY